MPWSQKPRPIVHYSTPCIASFSEDDWFFLYRNDISACTLDLDIIFPESSLCESEILQSCEQPWARASSAHWWSGTNAERVTTKLMSKLCGGHPLSILKNGKTMWHPPPPFFITFPGAGMMNPFLKSNYNSLLPYPRRDIFFPNLYTSQRASKWDFQIKRL